MSTRHVSTIRHLPLLLVVVSVLLCGTAIVASRAAEQAPFEPVELLPIGMTVVDAAELASRAAEQAPFEPVELLPICMTVVDAAELDPHSWNEVLPEADAEGKFVLVDFDKDGQQDIVHLQFSPAPKPKVIVNLYRNVGDGRFSKANDHVQVPWAA